MLCFCEIHMFFGSKIVVFAAETGEKGSKTGVKRPFFDLFSTEKTRFLRVFSRF